MSDWSENFESFALGDLGGQGGWVASGGGTSKQSWAVVPFEGGKALALAQNAGLDVNSPFASHAFKRLADGSLAVRMARTNQGHNYAFLQMQEGGVTRFFIVFGPISSEIKYSGGGYPWNSFSTPLYWVDGTAYNLILAWHANSTFDVSIDGTSVGTGLAFTSAMSAGIDGVQLFVGSSGDPCTVEMTIDNILVPGGLVVPGRIGSALIRGAR